jgi:hypothetical protein
MDSERQAKRTLKLRKEIVRELTEAEAEKIGGGGLTDIAECGGSLMCPTVPCVTGPRYCPQTYSDCTA